MLGGSFNPAHDGHRTISQLAIKHLQLDQVWWILSPQNPLKASGDIAPFEERKAVAETVADHPRIKVSEMERRRGIVHTVDTIAALCAQFPRARFVWIIGADNLLQIPQWKQWRQIFRSVPVAVFPRPNYSLRALSGKAARVFAGARIAPSRARVLALMKPPAWVFLQTRPHGASSTRIRAQRAQAGFLAPEQAKAGEQRQEYG